MNKFDKFWEASDSAGQLWSEIRKTFGKWGTFSIDNADVILLVSKLEKISPELLAVTWMNETTFRFYSEPNTNKHPEDFSKWDVGPMQLNVDWTTKDIAVLYYSGKGIDIPQAFGSKSQLFNGNPFENIRLASRKLLRVGKTDEERVVKYTGPDAREYRLRSWQEFAPMFRTFFNAYSN